jgi:hypothetical protein
MLQYDLKNKISIYCDRVTDSMTKLNKKIGHIEKYIYLF